jgi:Ca2+-binding RTX toxin-like protein
MYKNSSQVIKAGYNAIRQDGNLFYISGGREDTLYVRSESDQLSSIEIKDVQEYVTINR